MERGLHALTPQCGFVQPRVPEMVCATCRKIQLGIGDIMVSDV